MNLYKNKEKNFFFLLSGENSDLAYYEFQTILSLINIPFTFQMSPDSRIVELEFPIDVNSDQISENLNKIMNRVTMTHLCCLLIYKSFFKNSIPNSYQKLLEYINIDYFRDLKPYLNFSVRTKRIGDPEGIFNQKEITLKLNDYLGKQIITYNPTKKVNLTNPEEEYKIIISTSGIWIGIFLQSSLRNEVRIRVAHKRPFFHPSSMNPILQRTMINLSGLNEGELFLDPFCGSGGALIEANKMKIHGIGIEIDRKIIWGAYQNLKKDKEVFRNTQLILGDSTKLCFKPCSISAVITDPPYGIAASTKGFSLPDLLKQFFIEIKNILRPKSRLVICVPSYIEIEDLGAKILDAYYKIFFQYVHKSLTRKIIVFQIK